MCGAETLSWSPSFYQNKHGKNALYNLFNWIPVKTNGVFAADVVDTLGLFFQVLLSKSILLPREEKYFLMAYINSSQFVYLKNEI